MRYTGTPLFLLALFDNGLDSQAYQIYIIKNSLDGLMLLIRELLVFRKDGILYLKIEF